MSQETERARRIWDKQASRFDRTMSFWEKVLFARGREWARGVIGDFGDAAVAQFAEEARADPQLMKLLRRLLGDEK